MALGRRFFTNLAADFRNARPPFREAGDPDGTAFAVWMHMVTITANALALQNALFKYDRFYEACGMPQEAIDRVAG